MTRKLIALLLLLTLFPVYALADDDVVYYTLKSTGKAPYETVPIAPDGMFDDTDDLLTVDFIDRGAADCILLQCGGESLLVDGGKYRLFDHLQNVFSYLGITHFTYMLNTHAHDDHIEGLIKLLRHDYTPDLYMSCYGDDYRGSDYQTTVRELLAEKGIPYRQIGDGDTFTLGSAQITVFRDETPKIDKNRHSIVLKVVYGERSVLLMADAIGRTQEYLLAHYDASVFKADVLKYPHHGYVNMTTAFLDAVDPAVCVITNTRTAAALADKQLAYRGIPRYFTNEGVVRMQTDGHVWHARQMTWAWPLDVMESDAL
ncbi:MAG TPA: MBL fold metallo-hydrolase [Candidatus Limiplasma sp.]|nr:MBL fold metallo-hydrolase [Candidatus Limiplasma sp.]